MLEMGIKALILDPLHLGVSLIIWQFTSCGLFTLTLASVLF